MPDDLQMENSPKIYQYSIVSALMDGQTQVGIQLKELYKQGDFGLGAFQLADGEMILIDGTMYRMQHNGSISVAEPTVCLPYAMVTFYKPTVCTTIANMVKQDFQRHIEDITPISRNYFLAIRFEGFFKYLKVRLVKGQGVPGERLIEYMMQTQRVIEMENMEGTMLGFRSPQCYQGITVAGYHLHFISKDRTVGGHCLEYDIQEGDAGISIIRRLDTELPDSDDFYKADLRLNNEGIVKAEGG